MPPPLGPNSFIFTQFSTKNCHLISASSSTKNAGSATVLKYFCSNVLYNCFLKKFQNKINFFSTQLLPPANEVCEGYVFTGVCLSTGGGACMVAPGGHAWLLRGGMHGCSGGCAWLLGGGMRGCLGGHAWLLSGGACVVAPGGGVVARGCSCSGGACVVARGHAWLLPGGACVVFSMRYGQ